MGLRFGGRVKMVQNLYIHSAEIHFGMHVADWEVDTTWEHRSLKYCKQGRKRRSLDN